MANKDYYKILGVSEKASLDELKRSYRALALKYHPDRVPEKEKKAAEEKFKGISESFYVLSDPERRKEYDLLREGKGAFGQDFAYQSGFDFEELLKRFSGQQGGGFRGDSFRKYTFFDDLSDIFENIYAENYRSGPGTRRGMGGAEEAEEESIADQYAELQVPRNLAEKGGSAEFTLHGSKRITLNIKRGTKNGQKLRLRGQGSPCPTCRHRGDLILTIRVR